MRKFLDVDIIEVLRAVMERNTEHYQTDFEYDVRTIRQAAASKDPEDKCLLWMSRENGTWCLREREVYLRDTRNYNTWQAYSGAAADRVLAFAVLVDGTKDGAVRGNLYQLDYPQHLKHVEKVALPVERVAVTYEDGHTEQFLQDKYFPKATALIDWHGKIQKIMYVAENEQQLQNLLIREHRTRTGFPARTVPGFINILDFNLPASAAPGCSVVPLRKEIMLLDIHRQRVDMQKIKNRRFMFNPKTGSLILGYQYAENKISQSHAYEHEKSGTTEPYDDFVRGWVGTGRDYPAGVIHFAPAIVKDNRLLFDQGFDTLVMFQMNNTTGDTLVRGFGDAWEQPLSKILGGEKDVLGRESADTSAKQPGALRKKLARAKQSTKAARISEQKPRKRKEDKSL